jgi:predicted component of type VI protein secretion system
MAFGNNTTIDVQPERAPATTNLGDVSLTGGMVLILIVKDYDERFIFETGSINQLTIGRGDPTTGDSVDIDLTRFGARDKGVSRHHASIQRRASVMNIIDHESQNGTFLNGSKLVPNQTRVIRDGDEIRLGNLVLSVHLDKATS